ncbi:FecCD family ABC transporter permease [Pluralibacter gergoviae]|uniref:Iron ABC transporter permease n=1 Tax=Pluralibacter gergoviae TaxID=61647 RepID=A0AAW8HUU5_PLUGE|nr:iron ABC transporter permease [Pluralibacter gergoviae]AVR04529.1 iron ABC transporter permease [Pluralibacter gergoviae]ELC3075115.1 iron ABC transporter permease [Pluralibacter gergoviae]KMK02173.1 heme ABC transporter [Pluralibacter gergoviae]KMK23546.1 heme ABC transporter [Pluralibacter gergoviae]KOR00686.1 heme ABC transporter [Pluralibacter gergoviae]
MNGRAASGSLLRLLLICALLAGAAVLHLSTGARHIAPGTVVRALVDYHPADFEQRIVVALRLNRLLAALLVGGSLGMAGLLLQTLIRNPLGEPHILGLNAGASLAVVGGSALGFQAQGQPLLAALGAALVFCLVLALSGAGRGGITPLKVTLCGVALSAFVSSITAAILLFDEQTLLAVRTWLAGDLAGVRPQTLIHAGMTALCGAALALGLAPRLNVLALGDSVAGGLGINLRRTRLLGLLAVSLLCGAAVAAAGPVGFIGLLVPHLIRRLGVEDLRAAALLAMPVGALLLVLADWLARTLLASQELATGAVTALVGAPLFILLAARCVK